MATGNAGIYVLITPDASGKTTEWRVAYCQNINNLTAADATGDEIYMVLLFGNSEVYTAEDVAQKQAFVLEDSIKTQGVFILDLGISTIKLSKAFPTMTMEEAKAALIARNSSGGGCVMDHHEGLSPSAKEFLSKMEVPAECCKLCQRPFEQNLDQVASYIGMNNDEYPLYRHPLTDGRFADEFLQSNPYQNGPVFFIGLKTVDDEIYAWSQAEIDAIVGGIP